MLTDPFSLKSHSKLSPRRIAFTAKARTLEYFSRRNFETYALPIKIIPGAPEPQLDVQWSDTSVTREQMRHLLQALSDTEALGGSVVEVGAFRGVTTRVLAHHTARPVVAVDPFGGRGSVASDFDTFKKNIAPYPHVTHIRKTSGAAAKEWSHGPASLIFQDGVHDYANTSFDISAWWPILSVGGIMAFHDTDQMRFAGTRRAVYELVQSGGELFAHTDNITLVRKHR